MAKLYEGIKVLDLSLNIAAPAAASSLGDFGADVIKVERPVVGDDTRQVFPLVDGFSFSSWWFNRSKRSITIDLKDPDGIAILKSMIPHMDVLIESFRPGVMKKLGLGYEEVKALNPSIVYCSVSMYGQTGKDSQKSGYDLLAQARAGMLDITGEKGGKPIKSGFYISDYVASTHTYAAIASALYYREKTGKGQWLDISLLDCLFSYNSNFELAALNRFPTRIGNHAAQLAPYGVFEGSNNEFVAIVAAYNNYWKDLCEIMNRPDCLTDPDLSGPDTRMVHLDKVIDIIESWLKSFDDIRVPTKMMEDKGIPCSLVYNTKDLQNDEHLLSRNMIVELDTPTFVTSLDKIHTRGQPIKMSETPANQTKTCCIGEHNYEVLKEYGLTEERIDELQKRWSDAYYAKKG